MQCIPNAVAVALGLSAENSLPVARSKEGSSVRNIGRWLVMELSARHGRNFCADTPSSSFHSCWQAKPGTSWQTNHIKVYISTDSSLATSSIPSCSTAAVRPLILRPLKASVTRQASMAFDQKCMLWASTFHMAPQDRAHGTALSLS